MKKYYFDLSNLLKNEKLKNVEYEIEVVSIEENVKFEVNDEYLKKNGFKNEKDLKGLLKNNSIQHYTNGIMQIEKNV